MFGLQYLVGAFLVVPRASTPALIDKVNGLSGNFWLVSFKIPQVFRAQRKYLVGNF